jgi:hypothetical protein
MHAIWLRVLSEASLLNRRNIKPGRILTIPTPTVMVFRMAWK